MAIKVTFSLLAALVLLQGAFGAALLEEVSLQDQAEIAQGPITDTVRESLQRLTELVQRGIEESTSKLRGLSLVSALNPFKSQLTDVINKALGTIAEISQHATEIGIDITTCTLNSAIEINQLGFDTARELISCGTDKIPAASAIIEDAISQAMKFGEKVAQLNQELLSCRLSVICITRVSAKIAAATVEFPIQISRSVVQAVELVTSLQADLVNCAIKKVSASVLEIDGIVKTVGNCVAEKMNSN